MLVSRPKQHWKDMRAGRTEAKKKLTVVSPARTPGSATYIRRRPSKLSHLSCKEMIRIWQSTKEQMNLPQRHPKDIVMDKGPGETTEKASIQRCADFFGYERKDSLAEGTPRRPSIPCLPCSPVAMHTTDPDLKLECSSTWHRD